MMTVMAFGARVVLNLRYTIKSASFFTRTTLIQNSRRFLNKRGQILTQVPKVTLLCLGAVNASCSAARCQEAVLPSQSTERKSVARVQVHKVIFFLRLSLRALVLLLKFGPLLLLSPLTLVSARWASHWLDALLWVTETSGPTFIKLGQWASTRRDIFSQEFCERFSKLHVKVHPHPWAHTKQCLRRAFGEGWRRVLVFESKEPVGSGCVAQVYRGWAKADQVEDPAFQSLVEQMEKEDLLEAWEIPGLKGVVRSLRQLWSGSKEEEGYEERSHPEKWHEEGSAEKEHLIPVAIKVVHPGVRRQVEIDLLLMKAGSWLLQCLPGLKWLSLCEIVDEFEKLMTKQIDLRFEAKNIERFRENFRDVTYVKFPTPLRPFVTRTILVETFEESEPISNYLGSEIPQEVKQRIARMGVDTMLKMVFIDNFVHGDLHPGNILVQHVGPLPGSGDSIGTAGEAHGKTTLTDLWDTVVVSIRPEPYPLQLVLLDAGIVAQLSDHDLANFKAVFTAVVLRQGERVAELILNHARANDCKDVPQFKREMAKLVDHALSNPLSLGKIQVGDLLSRVFGLLIKHKVKLESNFASIVFAIMVLEGLGRSLDPNLDILDLAKPLLLKNCASLL
ncbi:putative aarF domain-containing protein kinase 2 isoform X1 [Halichoeres trimaculatus]|uniref:putative aarF domain-containing protein kinase 2 isoform X1 n=1 Tax=Halichoeres trimaculatus TaxID=147232 RepID=UPI003D9E4570